MLYITIFSIAISINSILIFENSWVGFSLFITVVGGILILFIIISSTIKRKISTSIKIKSFIFLFLFFSIIDSKWITFSSDIPKIVFSIKIEFIFYLILLLNIILFILSKIIISPIKPFRNL